MITHEQHYQNLWDNIPYYFVERKAYSISFGKAIGQYTFRDAVINTANNILNTHKKINFFLSGGLDSNVALRGFILAGIKNTFIVKLIKLDNGANNFDFQTGLLTCKLYGLKYDIINVNYDYYLNKEFIHHSFPLYINCPQYTLFLKIQKELDNSFVNIFGLGDFDFQFNKNYQKFVLPEYEFVGRFNRYCKNFIPFFRYDPNIIRAWLSDTNFLSFIQQKNKIENWNNYKNIFYSQHFPELLNRPKYTGIEKFKFKVRFLLDKIYPIYKEKNLIRYYSFEEYNDLIS